MAKKRTSRNDRRQAYKAQQQLLQYEASTGSKASLAKTLFGANLFSSLTAAKKEIDRISKGEGKLTADAKQALDSAGIKPASGTATESYRKNVLVPRQQRGIQSATRRKAKKTQAEITDTTTTVSQQRSNEKLVSRAARTTDSGVVLVGSKVKAKYAKLGGIVKNYQNVAGPQFKFYTVLLYETYPSATTGRNVSYEVIPGIMKMSTKQRIEALEVEFDTMTRGNGILKQVEFYDKKPSEED